ncbi:MAG: hypothetical protein ABI183_23070 [Polyangiaceae bacterium]
MPIATVGCLDFGSLSGTSSCTGNACDSGAPGDALDASPGNDAGPVVFDGGTVDLHLTCPPLVHLPPASSGTASLTLERVGFSGGVSITGSATGLPANVITPVTTGADAVNIPITAPPVGGFTITFTAAATSGIVASCTTTLVAAGAWVTKSTAGSPSVTVPPGVSTLRAFAWGAGGGGAAKSGSNGGGSGGGGGLAIATLTVATNDVLALRIGSGGSGFVSSASQVGAGGGGFSDIQSTSASLLVAGGGGGGSAATSNGKGYSGGAGGGTSGKSGSGGGGGGTASAGGGGGVALGTGFGETAGAVGLLGSGGSGAPSGGLAGGAPGGGTGGSGFSFFGGGGGGGGHYGGGGGGDAAFSDSASGGGGGGGSGYPSTATLVAGSGSAAATNAEAAAYYGFSAGIGGVGQTSIAAAQSGAPGLIVLVIP